MGPVFVAREGTPGALLIVPVPTIGAPRQHPASLDNQPIRTRNDCAQTYRVHARLRRRRLRGAEKPDALGFCDEAYLRDGQLQHAAFGHGNAVEAVHERHGDVIVGDDDETRVGRARHFFREIADVFDI